MSQRKNLDIEALRACAVLLTVVTHVRVLLPSIEVPYFFDTYFAWVGVDLFLCVSGFVIARSVAEAPLDFRSFALPFWVRRCWRILPTAWLWLAISVLLSAVFNDSQVFQSLQANIEGALAALLQVANLYWFNCFSAGTAATCGSSGVYWSLSLEEQFYLVFPFLILFLPRRLLLLALVLIVGLQVFTYRPFWSLGWALRTDAIAIGVLIALMPVRGMTLVTLERWPMRYVVPVLLLLALVALPELDAVAPFNVGAVALCAGMLVWIASLDRNYVFGTGQMKRLMVYVGSRSYSIYVVHVFAFLATTEILFRLGAEISAGATLARLAIGFGLTFGIAELNYRLVEVPLRRRGRTIAAKLAERNAKRSFSDAEVHLAPSLEHSNAQSTLATR